ncbi:Hypothetical predicted protein [Lecanosticta acicola]|uniref:Uncharacterized protein n=1 Tax=Lecanosticta acicola TaxID=111012 RepID=A0AAI9E8V2_9PEZI|nr:Hypothetical predicted protein [Lecanosticta acicola]
MHDWSWNQWHKGPYAEQYQQNVYNGFPFLPEFGNRRLAPTEEPFVRWSPGGAQGAGWYQGKRKLHGFKSKKYWARPVDGKRRGHWGRIKDGLTGEGADVFVVANGDRRTLHRELPSRAHWSHWDSTGMKWLMDEDWRARVEDMDWYPHRNLGSTRWAKRDANEVYDFKTRRYEHITPKNRSRFWSDAHWPNGKRSDHSLPTCWRSWDGDWHTTVHPTAGFWAGGRPLR